MSTLNLIKGLQLLETFRTDKGGYTTSAEHDVIYAYATDIPLTNEAKMKMFDLGWFQEDDAVDEDSWMFYT